MLGELWRGVRYVRVRDVEARGFIRRDREDLHVSKTVSV